MLPGTAVRVFDVNPSSSKARKTEYVVLGGRDLKTMAQAAPDLRNRLTYLSDSDVPITWYCVGGSVADQRNFLICEVIPDLYIKQGATTTQIIWIPCHDVKENTSFRTDVLEILDGVTKIKEFNLYHRTKFTIGLGKSWFAWGVKYEEANVRVEQLNLALDAAAYYFIKCRTANLTKFTNTNDPTKSCRRITVETHTSFHMDPSNYIDDDEPGFKLEERPLRRMREELRKMFRNLHVMPTWSDAVSAGDVKPPVMYIRGRRVTFPAPRSAAIPASKIIFERAYRRVTAYKEPSYSTDMPLLPIYDWEKLRITTIHKGTQITPELISLTSSENQFLETYVSHLSVTRGTFYATQVIRTRGFAEIENLDRELAEQVSTPPPKETAPTAPTVITTVLPEINLIDVTSEPTTMEKMETESEIITIQLPTDGGITEDMIVELIEDHLEIPANRSVDEDIPEWLRTTEEEIAKEKPWAEQVSEEDEPAQAMRRLSVKERSPSPTEAKVIPKRRRGPSPPLDLMCSGSSDVEFQRELTRQKRRVNREVAVLRDMVEEDERRQQRRLDKKRRMDERTNESLGYVAAMQRRSSKKGGVDETH